MQNKILLYIHGKGGSAQEAEQYRKNCPGFEVAGVDYDGSFPWTARPTIQAACLKAEKTFDQVWVLANSIGAYFAMDALQSRAVHKALFISPVLDMESLILDMMSWAVVSEDALRAEGEIPTPFGETLSWDYLCFVRDNPIRWNVPTEILYAGQDNLTSRQTVDAFLASHPRAGLTVMEGGEHWFHTEAQLTFLDGWMQQAIQ